MLHNLYTLLFQLFKVTLQTSSSACPNRGEAATGKIELNV